MQPSKAHTFECEHKVVERVHVLFAGLCIVLLDIFVDGPLNDVDGALEPLFSKYLYRRCERTSKLLAMMSGSNVVAKRGACHVSDVIHGIEFNIETRISFERKSTFLRIY